MNPLEFIHELILTDLQLFATREDFQIQHCLVDETAFQRLLEHVFSHSKKAEDLKGCGPDGSIDLGDEVRLVCLEHDGLDFVQIVLNEGHMGLHVELVFWGFSNLLIQLQGNILISLAVTSNP